MPDCGADPLTSPLTTGSLPQVEAAHALLLLAKIHSQFGSPFTALPPLLSCLLHAQHLDLAMLVAEAAVQLASLLLALLPPQRALFINLIEVSESWGACLTGGRACLPCSNDSGLLPAGPPSCMSVHCWVTMTCSATAAIGSRVAACCCRRARLCCATCQQLMGAAAPHPRTVLAIGAAAASPKVKVVIPDVEDRHCITRRRSCCWSQGYSWHPCC